MKLSACMIVKNEEETLRLTLPVLSAGVDEVILVDTGSTDKTVEIAEQFGARVFHFAWIDDFAAARNESLKHATGDWIIWIDADEYLTQEYLVSLKSALQDSTEESLFITIEECQFGTTDGGMAYPRIKVFRNSRGIHFRRAINEQLFTADGAVLDTKASLTSIKLAHWGKHLNERKMALKQQRNIRMLAERVKENGDDPIYHFLLGNNYLDSGSADQALAEYQAAYEVAPTGFLAAACCVKLGRLYYGRREYPRAFDWLKRAVFLEPENVEAYNLMAVILLAVRQDDEAINVLERARRIKMPAVSTTGVDVSQYGYFPHFLLGNAYLFKGDKAKALEMFRLAYGFKPEEKLKEKIEKLTGV